MKITIEEYSYIYAVDYSREDRIESGEVVEYFPKASEAINDFLRLLSCIYDRKTIAECLDGYLSAKEYWE